MPSPIHPRQFGPVFGPGGPGAGGAFPPPGGIPPGAGLPPFGPGGPLGPLPNPITALPDFLSKIFQIPPGGKTDDNDGDDDGNGESTPPSPTGTPSTTHPGKPPPQSTNTKPAPSPSTTGHPLTPKDNPPSTTNGDPEFTRAPDPLSPTSRAPGSTSLPTSDFSLSATPRITTLLPPPTDSPLPTPAAVAGNTRFPPAAIGAIIALCLLVIISGLLFWWRRRRPSEYRDVHRESTMISTANTGSTMPFFISADEAGVRERRADRANPFSNTRDSDVEDPFEGHRSWPKRASIPV